MGLDVYIVSSEGDGCPGYDCPHQICRRWPVKRDVIRDLFNGSVDDVKQNVSTFLKNNLDDPNTWGEKGVIGVFQVYSWLHELEHQLSDEHRVVAD
jgi:hypothetical protein